MDDQHAEKMIAFAAGLMIRIAKKYDFELEQVIGLLKSGWGEVCLPPNKEMEND